MKYIKDREARRGAAIYTRPALSIYDLFVIRLSNSLVWRCPSHLMLDQYNQFLGHRHLDVGPGTGWYLANARIPDHTEITLMDINRNTIDYTTSRLAHKHDVHRKVTANVLDPVSDSLGKFNSIATNFLAHCLPGSWKEKGIAFTHLGGLLSDKGTLFGGTILGSKVRHNVGGRGLMTLYNRAGVFHNREDDESGLRDTLESRFRKVSVDVVGTVALFSAQEPRR